MTITLEELRRFFPIADIQRQIAGDVWPNGAILSCDKCGKIREITQEDCARYLRNGWPKCHGRTMTMEKKA